MTIAVPYCDRPRTSRRRYGIIFVLTTMVVLTVTVVAVMLMAGGNQAPYRNLKLGVAAASVVEPMGSGG